MKSLISALLLVFSLAISAFSQDRDGRRSLITFVEISDHIQKRFHQELNMDECIGKILQRGISYCTDPYSFYLNDKQTEDEQVEFKGKFGGIGVSLEMKHGDAGATILRVNKNSPAAKASLRAGDIIIAVATAPASNYVFLEGLAIKTAIDMIRGEVGTKVFIKILRNKQTRNYPLTREITKIEYLESKEIGNIGYINLKEFSGEDLIRDFQEAVANLWKKNIKVLIIDLRNNPGGRLDFVTRIACWFSKDGCNNIVFTKTRSGDYIPYAPDPLFGVNGGMFKGFKLIILQNQYSASASEILSGYLKADAGAAVIGVKSYGKGSVQSIFPLQSGGALHLTIAEYFVGKNKLRVNGVGIEPTIKVENRKPAKGKKPVDQQMEKALEVANKFLNKK